MHPFIRARRLPCRAQTETAPPGCRHAARRIPLAGADEARAVHGEAPAPIRSDADADRCPQDTPQAPPLSVGVLWKPVNGRETGRPESRPLSFVPHCPIVFRRLFGCLSLLSLSAVVLPFFLPLSVCRFSSAVSFAAVIPPPFPAPFRSGRVEQGLCIFHP